MCIRDRLCGVSCAIETAGDAPASKLLPLAKLCDEVLFDLKIMDAAQARDVYKRQVRRLCHSICDEKVLHSVSTWLAGRAWTPLGSSQINSTIRAIAFRPVRFSVYRIRAHGNGLPCDKSAKSWTNVM